MNSGSSDARTSDGAASNISDSTSAHTSDGAAGNISDSTSMHTPDGGFVRASAHSTTRSGEQASAEMTTDASAHTSASTAVPVSLGTSDDAGELLLSGNICYTFSFSIMEGNLAIGAGAGNEALLRQRLRNAFPLGIFDDSEEAADIPFFRDIRTAQGFLHSGGLPFQCFRMLTRRFSDMTFPDLTLTGTGAYISVFPEYDTAQIGVYLSFRDCPADMCVYLRQLQGNGAKFTDKSGSQISVTDIFNWLKDALDCPIDDIEQSYILEVNHIKAGGGTSMEDIDVICRDHTGLIYGLLCGDEGWRDVPDGLAETRLTNTWGSRTFVRFISFGNNSLLFNFNEGRAATEYLESRKAFDAAYYGDVNPYFLIRSDVAGINHGILFSLETVLVIKTICTRILRRQAVYTASTFTKMLNRDIKRTKLYRSELIMTLNKVQSLDISEIGELERVILRSHDIEPIIDNIKYLLELLESELDLLYQNSTNRFVNILTVAGLVIALVQVFQGL